MNELALGQPRSDSDGSTSSVSESARILLRRVFRILQGCGMDSHELRAMAEEEVGNVEKLVSSQPNRVTARQAFMCCDVVLKWRRDPRFLDSEGLPNCLSPEGHASSFSELARIAAPGEEWPKLLANMTDLGVVRITDQKTIELISDSVVACSGQDGSVIASECVLEHICGFLGSVEYNVFDKPSREKGRFERACYATVPKELVPVLQDLVRSRGQNFVDVIDEWLARRSIKSADGVESVLVGAGAYVFVRKPVQ